MTTPTRPGAPNLPTSYGNPYLTVPGAVSAGTLTSGGGADGFIDYVVAMLLQRVNLRPTTPISGLPPEPGSRTFDMAELIAWTAAACGVAPIPPMRADLLRSHCYQYRSNLRSVAQGLRIKGAIMFGYGAAGLSLGSRNRVIIYDPLAGVVVDDHRYEWTEAALLPGARGYR